MKKVIALLVLALVGSANAQWGARLSTDAKMLEGGIVWGRDRTEIGIVASWHENDPDHLYGIQAIAFLEVVPEARFPLKELLPFIGDWLNLPETIAGKVKLGAKIGAVNLAGDRTYGIGSNTNPIPPLLDAGIAAAGGPIIEIETGPITWSFHWQILEAGGKSLPLDQQGIFMVGVVHRF